MGRNVFVSYKYADTSVQRLARTPWYEQTKVRDYVDEIEILLANEGHVYYGEHEGEDLSEWTEERIWRELKSRIFPTSCTIVLISPNMKNPNSYDKSQWIPWEVRYSLIETVRDDHKSHRNGILAVVLPNREGDYDYAIKENRCCSLGCKTFYRDWLFTIIKENMFNRINPIQKTCNEHSTVWYGEYSYIPLITWDYFITHVSESIERAIKIKDDYEATGCYELHLSVNQ